MCLAPESLTVLKLVPRRERLSNLLKVTQLITPQSQIEVRQPGL